MVTPAAIDVAGVSVAADGVSILRDVTLAVGPGEWVGVIGPNGAGKSTLLRAIAGLVPAEGRIVVGGLHPHTARRRDLARVLAYVPQDPVMPDGMTVLDYALLGRTAHLPYLGVESRHDLAVVGDVLEELDLERLVARVVTSLSGGEQQRLTLARALAQESAIVVLDEPTSALDIGNQQHVLDLIERLRRTRGLAVLSAMHDLTLAGQFADRLVLLSQGRSVIGGSPAEVLTEPLLSEHWHARVRVLEDPEGNVVVLPVHERRPSSLSTVDQGATND